MQDHRPINDIPRWQMAAHAAVSLIPGEDQAARSYDGISVPDAARLAMLQSRLGDVSHTFLHGQQPLEDDLLRLAGSALAWAVAIEAERAR